MIHWKFKINIKLNQRLCLSTPHRTQAHDNFFRRYSNGGKYFKLSMAANNENEWCERTMLNAHCANLNSSHEHSSVQCDFQMSNLIKNDAALFLVCVRMWMNIRCCNKFKWIPSRLQSRYFSQLSFAIYFNPELVWIC